MKEKFNKCLDYINEAHDLVRIMQTIDIPAYHNKVLDIAGELIHCTMADNNIFIAGNGGSAAEAQHFAAELTGRYKKERPGINCEALHCDTSFLTAWSNDYNYDFAFQRLLQTKARPDDCLIVLTTSGKSNNILYCVEWAKQHGVKTIGLTSSNTTQLHELLDYCIQVPSTDTPRIQEVHLFLLHEIARIVEEAVSA